MMDERLIVLHLNVGTQRDALRSEKSPCIMHYE